ncbi:hypothetical protein L1887_32863 [Cichorium endivia]|nr:hypothetical protein L1887_32863 [Cichorium endivia]
MTSPSTTTNSHKAFGVTNIKSYVPLVLDLERLNYDAWKELFTTHCVGFDVIDHIDDTHPKPTDSKWKKIDSIVKLWIYGSISSSLLLMVLKKDASALQVWTNLESLFRDNKDAKSMQLDSELRNITMGDLSVTAYCTKIKSLADLLANLDPDSAVPDKHLVNYTINGLSAKFDSVANIIRYRSPLPTFTETRSMLLMEEQRMSHVRPGNGGDNSSSSTILHVGNTGVSTGQQNQHRNKGRRQDRRQPPSQQRGQRTQQSTATGTPQPTLVQQFPPAGHFSPAGYITLSSRRMVGCISHRLLLLPLCRGLHDHIAQQRLGLLACWAQLPTTVSNFQRRRSFICRIHKTAEV